MIRLASKSAASGLVCDVAGAFVAPDGKPLPVPEGLPNAHMRLYGGAQYHRAMAEFRAAVGAISCPDISREEVCYNAIRFLRQIVHHGHV